MSVQINLIPDARVARQNAQRNRQLVSSLATLISAGFIGAVVILLLVTQGQNFALRRLQSDIDAKKAEVQSKEGLQEALTVQQHLASLPGLYQQRTYTSRFISVLQTVAPAGLSVSSVSVDKENVLSAGGLANSYELAAKFAKALEASNVSLGQGASDQNQPHFTNVKLSSLSQEGDGKVSFSLTATMSSEVTSAR